LQPQATTGVSTVKVLPYHTTSIEYPPSHRNVYHDHRECHYGRHILPQDRVAGTGNKPRCQECIKLD
jgi:hypothetical protein